MEPISPDHLPVFLASSPGSAAIFDWPEEKLDQPENVVPSRSRSMVLRSHSRAGRSKSSVPEKRVGATRPELENVQPEMEDVSYAGRAMMEIPDSPDIDSSGETGKTPSGPTFPGRQEPEMEIAVRPSIHPSSSTDPQPNRSFFSSIFTLMIIYFSRMADYCCSRLYVTL